MVTSQEFETGVENKWCPGCGNFGILSAMTDALVQLQIPPDKLLIVSGIGQAAKTPHYMQCNVFHGLHGRALPVATGAKIANHELTVIVNSGDGDCYGEGGNHFMHAIRRNLDILLLVHNNMIYGLTKGQASPTTALGMTTQLQPQGVISEPLNPLALALSLGAGFVARGFSGHGEHLSRLIREGIEHRGFSLIDILQPCVSFNRLNTFAWFRDRVYDLFDTEHDPEDYEGASVLSREYGERIPIGILYREEKPTFTDRIGILDSGPLISQSYDPRRLEAAISSL